MKFHVTIKDNETGEILNDQDCDEIIGGISDDEQSASIVLTSCNGKTLLFCARATSIAIDKAIPKDSPIYNIFELFKLLKKGDKEDKEENEVKN